MSSEVRLFDPILQKAPSIFSIRCVWIRFLRLCSTPLTLSLIRAYTVTKGNYPPLYMES